ncbi:VPA1267 family protein [Sulfuritalea hydrogenivorans]|uniref:Uncharacterized protein n=1 Tax=Sulfuritalea hydrogenivorans sk43H TaxID=1223802 RepID=W0SGZ9_9PROT|nr:VPA1267 family protein [Sulfuritalea hydrogenivorans]BAO30035.1 hypothetical protein SUTH_02245 [Sulfuritalea hydrogenivorans sk43H]
MIQLNRSGQQLAVANVKKFGDWVAERDAAGDWQDYTRAGKLNRSEIANECGFALSVVRQNPAVKAALETLETSLRERGLIGGTDASTAAKDDPTALALERRVMAAKGKAEQRVKALEEQNAALRAEIGDLREQLARYRHLDEHLCRTGRMLPP